MNIGRHSFVNVGGSIFNIHHDATKINQLNSVESTRGKRIEKCTVDSRGKANCPIGQ